MGCDIHMYREKQIDGVWLAADKWTPSEYDDGRLEVKWDNQFHDRNYELFGALSKGVRREYPFSFEVRGLPFDVCPQIKNESDSYGCDGHSHSYLFLHELKSYREFLDTQTILIKGFKHKDELAILRESIATGTTDWSLLYPYCGGTNAPDYEKFEFAVPASFSIGGALDRIIEMFDNVDGELQRIVFWFDN